MKNIGIATSELMYSRLIALKYISRVLELSTLVSREQESGLRLMKAHKLYIY
jgi:hypothetical protein